MIIKNALVLNDDFRFIRADVCTEGGVITSIYVEGATTEEMSRDGNVVDAQGAYLVPGLIDIHSHGAVGCDHLDGTIESTAEICKYMAKKGTTSIFATIMTQSREKMLAACENVAEYKKGQHEGAHIRGVYLEGPFFTQKHKGAQHPDHLQDADIDFFKRMCRLICDKHIIISLSPERQGSELFTKEVTSGHEFSGVRVFMGHTDSDYDMAKIVINAGATGLTHTFNGMRPLHHRDPGVIAAALNNKKVLCECICDGIHVHPAMVRMLYDHIGRDRFVAISDSIKPAGFPDGKYTSGGQKVTVKGNIAYLGEPGDGLHSSTIAGSMVCLFDCVKNLVKWNITTVENAFCVASAVPAKAAGIYGEVGSISVGKAADLLIVDKDFVLREVFIEGIRAYREII